MLVQIYPIDAIQKPRELEKPVMVIGRDSSCDIVVDVDSISRKHAVFEYRNGVHYLCDNQSTNGTFVNERRIDNVELRSGDRLRFGNQIFKFLTTESVETQYHEVIFKMMTTDGLTQVYNKRFFQDSLERQYLQAQRGGQPMCVMILDLDKFKSINDTHGHLAGDAVLVEFARRTSAVLRGGELMARIGGEEFAILCSPATLEQAAVAAERVLKSTSSSPVTFESIEIPMTVSIGIACYDGESDLDTTSLVARADSMLYRAKTNGRNQFQMDACSANRILADQPTRI